MNTFGLNFKNSNKKIINNESGAANRKFVLSSPETTNPILVFFLKTPG